MNKFGIKISKKGMSAIDTKGDKLIFTSENDTIPIYQQLPFTVKVAQGTQSGTTVIKHDLPFTPFLMAWGEDEVGGKKFLMPFKTTNFYSYVYSYPESVEILVQSQAPGWYADKDYIFNGFVYIFRKGTE